MPEAVNPGDVLDGKYVVEWVLGSGGMGMVVAAKHVALGSRVAVKFMLREAMHDARNVERFKREARLAVQLKSLHAARVIDVGELPNGEPYMVMEYLEGQDLDQVLRRSGPMPVSKAVDYILQASEAIAEAHARGMIHRDIKPKNLFVTQSVDGTPLVKVLDFGLGKHLGGANKGSLSLTAPAAVFGSPYYMSPEQMRSAKDADTRSDVWSLGVCLYEMLTGRLPFDAPRVAKVCAMVLNDPAPPPRGFRPELPAPLEAIVLRTLEKAPARRFQSVAELAFALEAFALEGSGKRILAVMETARRPSLRPPSPGGPLRPLADPRALVKTISSWDSGERTHLAGWPSMTRGARIGVAAAAMIVTIGLGVLEVLSSPEQQSNPTTGTKREVPYPATLPRAPEPAQATTETTATATPANSAPPAVASAHPVLEVGHILELDSVPDMSARKPGAPAASGKPPEHPGATRPPTATLAKPATTATTATAPPQEDIWDTP